MPHHLPDAKGNAAQNPVLCALKDIKPCLSSQSANTTIRQLVESTRPCMVARFGSVELQACIKIQQIERLGWAEALYRKASSSKFRYSEKSFIELKRNAGFFPIKKQDLIRFHELMLASMQQVDLLGSWVAGENLFEQQLSKAVCCELRDLESYYHAQPWTAALEGKKVLVIHPFSESIKKQYFSNRKLLFQDPAVLPDFELTTIQAVQSIAGNKTPFDSWFDALESMLEGTANRDFDVAILGCGAYGFPLAAEIKRMNKKAIHLGGATQLLFGIKGARWDNHPLTSRYYNQHWIRPSEEEKPMNAASVEGACYW